MAARETGALKEAKDKLEKRVEELTWRLELEKHQKADLEEAKAQEIASLQNTVTELQQKLDEAQATIVREKEAAKLAIEQAPPVIKEVPVVDNTQLELLSSQNHKLEVEVEKLKEKIEEFEAKCSAFEKDSKESLIEAENAKAKAIELQEIIERLHTNLSNLESENQILRQQALSAATITAEDSGELNSLKDKVAILESENESLRKQTAAVENIMPPGCKMIVQNLENGPQTEEINATKEPKNPITVLAKQRSLTDKQQESHDVLIKCLIDERRFDNGRSLAAWIVYKSLLQWRSFEAEKTNIFDRIVHTIRSSIEKSQDETRELTYWLTTTSTLLYLLQSTLKFSNTNTAASRRNRSPQATLFGRLVQGVKSSSMSLETSNGYSGMVGISNEKKTVEAKYPALLFKQHLAAYVEKTYGMIRDNLKKEINPLLNLCIHAPRPIRAGNSRDVTKSIHLTVTAKQQASYVQWQNIINKLEHTLSLMAENHVPSMITRKLFHQVFSYINVQLFNSLLLRRECCSFSNGEYLKMGLYELEQWCLKAEDESARSPWDELQPIRQAVKFLVLHQKTQRSLDEITKEICPVLSIPQVYRIGTMFWDDKYGTQGLSPEVIKEMRKLMSEDSVNMTYPSFLLDVDSSIPFSVEDVSQSFHGGTISLSDVDPPPRSDFHFLFHTLPE